MRRPQRHAVRHAIEHQVAIALKRQFESSVAGSAMLAGVQHLARAVFVPRGVEYIEADETPRRFLSEERAGLTARKSLIAAIRSRVWLKGRVRNTSKCGEPTSTTT